MSEVNLQPEKSDVLQEEPPEDYEAVRVCIESAKIPLRLQQLPRKAGATRTRTIGATAPVKVLAADHYRAKATIISLSEYIWIALSQSASQDTTTMSQWPSLVPFVLEAGTEVWVMSTANTTPVSVTTELWATGE